METQQSINEWALATFGVATPQRMIARAIEEGAELLAEVTKPNIDVGKIAEECADIVGPLCRVAEVAGCDLTPVLDATEFIVPNHVYSPAVKIMSRLVFIMEMLGPMHVARREDMARQLGMVVLSIAELCASTGISLRYALETKMAVLKSREWVLDGTGCGYHVVDKTAPVTQKTPD